ncbi:tRNA wybutosine-synthesizing protein 3 homolog [Uloborus diversus]|uniref:tRNA wybutosine-synthesizing protein 3 homolog n=1 Tax=Uloborus diversus TaxID=327109 RepID=UPI0024099007|nr:tRNA wybutosine-synthesizing protein 3 homolog [Uloborus diversus]
MQFSAQKEICLKKADLSKKGSVDSRISDLVNVLNSHPSYFTTSSCSGRAIIFTSSDVKKKGCSWIFVSHDQVSSKEIINSLKSHSGSAVLKFEPFILHVQCSTIADAQKMHALSIQSGFRNSGFSIGRSGKIILAVRSTLALEVPISSEGCLLVSSEYIAYIVDNLNQKMEENWQRTQRFYLNIQASFSEKENMQLVLAKEKASKQLRSQVNKEPKYKSPSPVSFDSFCDGFENLLKN